MPEISLLEPTVLRGVVEKLVPDEALVMLNRIPRTPWPYPSATWDVIRGSRAIAAPNVPNSEAHIVPRLGVSQQSAAFVYLREKKVFEPTTLHWIREPGQLARTNAEAAVLREVNDLNRRFDAFAEYTIWKAMSGTLTLDYPDVKATVDYQIPASHKPSVGVSWATATAQQIIEDIQAWRRIVNRDGRVPIRQGFLTEATANYIFGAFTDAGNNAVLISDRMKDQYFQTGTLPGFMGIDWTLVESYYEDSSGNVVNYLEDDALILANLTDNRPMELIEGPTADDEAPRGFTGKFAKTWKEKDPSARQHLLEWHFLPVITRPEQFIYVSDVTTP